MTIRVVPAFLLLGVAACSGDDSATTSATDGGSGTDGTGTTGDSATSTSGGSSPGTDSASATGTTGATTSATGTTGSGSGDTGTGDTGTGTGGGGFCGDGVMDAGEECDDAGNGDQDDGCTDACTVPTCGDAYVQASLDEECDDGNQDGTDGCLATCILGAPPILYYPLDTSAENAGSLGSTYDGAANMVTWDAANKKFGSGAAQITGTGEITISDTQAPLSASPDYTLSVWYWEEAEQAADLVRTRQNLAPGGGMHIYDGAAAGVQITMCYTATPSGSGCGNAGITSVGTWHNVTFRCDGDGLTAPDGCDVQIYLDGELKDTVLTSGNVIFSPNQAADMVLGNDSAYTIDEVKVYDAVFSDQGQCVEVWGGTWDVNNDTCTLP